VLFHLAALTGQDVPAAAPPSTMVALFDGYAEKFDEHLTGHLKYRCPELLHEAVAALKPRAGLNVLDLGCGTGLCGPLFRPLAASLAGVDLSPAMIDKARRRGVYDRLEVGDLVTALRRAPGTFDLLLAADVLVYVGDLSPVLSAAAAALGPSGLFAFSVEEHHGAGYALLPTRRYAHSVEYLKSEAARVGLDVVEVRDAIPRIENGRDVRGLIVILRRPAEARG
jgi:predicted TPR repeat methyltransferase